MSATLPILWMAATFDDDMFTSAARQHLVWPSMVYRQFKCGHEIFVKNKLPFELNNHAKCFCCRMLEGK